MPNGECQMAKTDRERPEHEDGQADAGGPGNSNRQDHRGRRDQDHSEGGGGRRLYEERRRPDQGGEWNRLRRSKGSAGDAMNWKERLEQGPRAHNPRQEPLRPDAVHHRVNRQAVDQELGQGGGECRVPSGAIDGRARGFGKTPGVAVDEIFDRRPRGAGRDDEAEELGQVPHRCADGGQCSQS